MELDGQPVGLRAAEPLGDVPVLYLHGVPTSGADWAPFLARTGGLAPDLPGFGRSGKSGEHPYDLPFYEAWLERFLQARCVERVRLVVHDWGAVGLAWAQRHPERVERLVVVDAVPLLPGFRWHAVARAWRTPVLGELLMGATTRWGARRVLGRAVADVMWETWDLGTQRAILRLYRSADPDVLAQAGARLGDLRAAGVPALVVWGGRDPFLGLEHGRAYAERLGAELVELPDAGHWPWLDRPDVVERVAAFLAG